MALQRRTHSLEALMRYAKRLGFGDIHTCINPQTGLHAYIAIHNTQRGPAIGGCRLYSYTSSGQALKDLLRLSYMMTLKSAICELPHGGGKAVIIQPKQIQDRQAFFQSFGDFVHSQNGRYITAIDVGTGTQDMDAIASRTPYVIGAKTMLAGHGNPAEHTALGVFQGIRAAMMFLENKTSLKGLHVAIQGIGQVGLQLIQRLQAEGAKLTVCDVNQSALQQLKSTHPDINIVGLDEIYAVPCDVFAPCAMGGILRRCTINKLQCKVIAGSANNQLAHAKYINLIQQRGILFAPDFLVNAGGLINAALVYDCADPDLAHQHILKIYETTLHIFERAAREQSTTTAIAEKIAMERLAA